ncbi:alpha/beta hydrolase [Chitinophagaceae bacterium MMS25-I14]
MKNIQSKKVVFITGSFVGHAGWDNWKMYFESRGYKTMAPPWPKKEGTPAALRSKHPDSPIASVRLGDVIEHYAGIVAGLPEKPILIGHSMGGLITQILVNRGLAAAGIGIHSVPPQGIFPTQWSFFKSTWRALGLFTSLKKTYLMSFKTWQYAFTNGMSPAEQKKAWKENAIPESKQATRDGLTSVAKVDFKKAHAPLLILAGSTDHCVPAALNKKNYDAYKKDNGSVTDFKVMDGRNHFVLGQPTWREDADYILDWINRN